MADDISKIRELKRLKFNLNEMRRIGTIDERQAIQVTIREKIKAIADSPERLAIVQNDVFNGMADIVDEIAKIEGEMMRELRLVVGE